MFILDKYIFFMYIVYIKDINGGFKMTAKLFLEKNINSQTEATWIDPDEHDFSIEYLKRVARQLGYHAKGTATVIIFGGR